MIDGRRPLRSYLKGAIGLVLGVGGVCLVSTLALPIIAGTLVSVDIVSSFTQGLVVGVGVTTVFGATIGGIVLARRYGVRIR